MMKTENEEEMKCPSCGSNDIRKNGMILKNKGRRIQRFQCKDCGYCFTLDKKKKGEKRP